MSDANRAMPDPLNFAVEKVTVTAKSRKLSARWTTDPPSNIDVETELSNILRNEIENELKRKEDPDFQPMTLEEMDEISGVPREERECQPQTPGEEHVVKIATFDGKTWEKESVNVPTAWSHAIPPGKARWKTQAELDGIEPMTPEEMEAVSS